jgi:hypothetical protein
MDLVYSINVYYANLRYFQQRNLPRLVSNIRASDNNSGGEEILRNYFKTGMSLRVDVSAADSPAQRVLLENIKKLEKLNLGRLPEPSWEVECFLKSDLR